MMRVTLYFLTLTLMISGLTATYLQEEQNESGMFSCIQEGNCKVMLAEEEIFLYKNQTMEGKVKYNIFLKKEIRTIRLAINFEGPILECPEFVILSENLSGLDKNTLLQFVKQPLRCGQLYKITTDGTENIQFEVQYRSLSNFQAQSKFLIFTSIYAYQNYFRIGGIPKSNAEASYKLQIYLEPGLNVNAQNPNFEQDVVFFSNNRAGQRLSYFTALSQIKDKSSLLIQDIDNTSLVVPFVVSILSAVAFALGTFVLEKCIRKKVRDKGKCKAITAKGKPCRNFIQKAEYCYAHKNIE